MATCRHRNSRNPWMKSQLRHKSTTQVTKMKSKSRMGLLLKSKKKRKRLMIKWLILRCSHSTISWGRYEVQWAQRYDAKAWDSVKLKTMIIANNAYRRIAPSGQIFKTEKALFVQQRIVNMTKTSAHTHISTYAWLPSEVWFTNEIYSKKKNFELNQSK